MKFILISNEIMLDMTIQYNYHQKTMNQTEFIEDRMKRFYLTCLLFSIMLLVSCTTVTKAPGTTENTDELLAQQTLVTFLDNLYKANYKAAAQSYGGIYDIMIEHNPDIDASDHAALLKNACTINGAQCLAVSKVDLDRKISKAEYTFKVQFLNSNGSVFVRGPCCGANETDSPSEYTFIFRVIKNTEGKFLVMDMPPYLP